MGMTFTPLRRLSDDVVGFGSLSELPSNWGEAVALSMAQIDPMLIGTNWLLTFEGQFFAIAPETLATDYEEITEEQAMAALLGLGEAQQ